MTTIREAVPTDVASAVGMVTRFLSSPPYNSLIEFDEMALVNSMSALIGGSDSVVFVAELDGRMVGVLGLRTYVHPVSGHTVCGEIFWWVDPAFRGMTGLRLLKVGEAWATERGARTLFMIAPTDDIEKLYSALKYKKVEVSYKKELWS
jgi:hypothetical protein